MQMIPHADMSDLDAVAALESECFPPAEAASRDAIADRLRTYADHFWLLFDDDRLTAAITQALQEECGIAANRVYIAYEGIENWGWNGHNF